MDDRRLNRDAIKRVNRNLVLNLVKSAGPLSRRDIVRRSGLSAATVTNLTAELITEDLVHEMGPGETTRGRPPVLLRLNNRAGFVAGVKVMEDSMAAVVTDLDAEVLAYRNDPLPPRRDAADRSSVDPGEAVAAIALIVDRVLEDAGVNRSAVLGVGLGLAGLMDSQAGKVVFSPFFSWRDVDLAGPLGLRLGMNVILENDVNALTIAEQWFGHGHDYDHFCVVTVGSGVGLGLVVNGQFYRGAGGGAGELGHITLVKDGPACYCGKNGCLEMLASDRALLSQAAAMPDVWDASEELTVADLVMAAERGDSTARDLLAESGHWLGVGIANVVNLFNPGLVIIGGEGVHAGEWRFASMRRAFEEHVFNGLADQTEFVIEPAGDDTWARGAACVVLGEMFKSPLQQGRGVSLPSSAVGADG